MFSGASYPLKGDLSRFRKYDEYELPHFSTTAEKNETTLVVELKWCNTATLYCDWQQSFHAFKTLIINKKVRKLNLSLRNKNLR